MDGWMAYIYMLYCLNLYVFEIKSVLFLQVLEISFMKIND